MTEYKLKIVWRVYEPDEDKNYAVCEKEDTFTCTVESGQLLIPVNAQRVICKRAGSLGVVSMGWVGEKPDVFACGALTEEQAAMLSEQANVQADLAMKLLAETEPEKKPSIRDLIGPREGEVKVIGEADYETDVPLLHPELDDTGG